MKEILYKTLMCFLILTMVGIVGVAYLSFFHMMNPVDFNNEPVPIVQEGRNLCATIDYTRHTVTAVTITRTYRDGIMFVSVPLAASSHPKGTFTEKICWAIPSTLPSGEYTIQTDLEFQVNIFAHRTSTWMSEAIYIHNED